VKWVNAFKKRGLNVILVTLHKPLSGISNGIKIYRLPFPAPIGYFFNIFLFKKILKKEKPDILNVHYASGYGTLARLSKFHPLILNVWGSDVYEFPDTSFLHKNILLKNLYNSDYLCSTSKIMAERVKHIWPTIPNIFITPFGVDCKIFLPESSNLIENKPIVIGTVKSLAPKYGITTLVKAFYEAKRKVSNHDLDIANKMRLRIVGEGPQLNEIKNLIKDLNLNSIASIKGTIANDKVPYELRNFDIYCAFSESESESFGVAIIEASACGIPVIVNKIGGLAEVTIDKVTGIQVEKGNIHDASEAILKLVLNKQLRLEMGKSGRDFVLNNFDWDDNVDKMIGILQQGYNNFALNKI